MLNNNLHRIKLLLDNDKDLSLFGAKVHKYNIYPPINQKEAAAIQVKYNIEFPKDYLNYLLTVSNGGAGPGFGLYRFSDPTLEEFDYGVGEEIVKFNLNPEDFNTNKEYNPEDFIGYVTLCSLGDGIYYLLCVKGNYFGNVWIFDLAGGTFLKPVLDKTDLPITFSNLIDNWLENSEKQLLFIR